MLKIRVRPAAAAMAAVHWAPATTAWRPCGPAFASRSQMAAEQSAARQRQLCGSHQGQSQQRPAKPACVSSRRKGCAGRLQQDPLVVCNRVLEAEAAMAGCVQVRLCGCLAPVAQLGVSEPFDSMSERRQPRSCNTVLLQCADCLALLVCCMPYWTRPDM